MEKQSQQGRLLKEESVFCWWAPSAHLQADVSCITGRNGDRWGRLRSTVRLNDLQQDAADIGCFSWFLFSLFPSLLREEEGVEAGRNTPLQPPGWDFTNLSSSTLTSELKSRSSLFQSWCPDSCSGSSSLSAVSVYADHKLLMRSHGVCADWCFIYCRKPVSCDHVWL